MGKSTEGKAGIKVQTGKNRIRCTPPVKMLRQFYPSAVTSKRVRVSRRFKSVTFH